MVAQIEAGVLGIAASPAFEREPTCFAASMAGLYRSEDGGQTWRSILQTDTPIAVTAVAVSPAYQSDRSVFAGVSGGVLRSWDGGQSWNASALPPPPPTVSALVISPAYAADSTLFAGTADDGVFRSGDRGASWEAWNFGLLDRNVLSLAISPAYQTDETLFAGTASGLFRSRNGGRAWREVDFPTAPVLGMAISPGFANDRLIYAGTETKGLFVSKDGGQRWSSCEADVLRGTINAVGLSPLSQSRAELLVATTDGLYTTRDAGASWEVLISGSGILALAAPRGLAERTPILLGLAEGGVRSITRTDRGLDI